MPISTRSGAVVDTKPEHYGRYGLQNSTLPGQRRNKKKTANTRSQVANATPAPDFQLPATPPDKEYDQRILRHTLADETPFCSVYGSNRKLLYPLFHFCSPCTMYDSDKKHPSCKNKIKRSSPSFKCTAKHESWACPTQLIEDYLCDKAGNRGVTTVVLSGKKRKVSRAEVIVEDDEATIPSLPEVICIQNDIQIERLEEMNRELKEYNMMLHSEIYNMTEVIRKHEAENIVLLQENNELCDEVQQAMQLEKHVKTTLSEKINRLKEVNDEKNSKIEQLNKKMKSSNRNLKIQTDAKDILLQHMRNNINNVSSCKDVVALFMKNLERLSTEKNRNLAKLANDVVNILWDRKLLDGLFVEKMMEKAKEYIRATIFSPSNILRAMDMCGGTLSMQSIEVLRKLEKGCKGYDKKTLLYHLREQSKMFVK
jgi:hypothetical protein